MSDIETRQKKLPVLLFIRGEQYFDDVDPDATELTTEGTLELTEEGLLLTYQETALTGMEGRCHKESAPFRHASHHAAHRHTTSVPSRQDHAGRR